MNMHFDNMGWNFDNSYARLPERFYTKIDPNKSSQPQVVIFNYGLADEIGLNYKDHTPEQLAQIFSGNQLPKGAEPLSQAYAGYQFGHFSILGDGRAHLLGEQITPQGNRIDIQLKGSGKTPYSRGGDGRAALGPMLREYLISEAMYALGIPTTRSLAVVTTSEPVYRHTVLLGAILTRIAASHLRVGTFEYLAAKHDLTGLKTLADYAIHRHYPDIKNTSDRYLHLLQKVMERQIDLVIHWLRVGFIHGVMNTDNMSIAGETIDYGPCAFMDHYNPQTVFSSIDQNGRYAFMHQPRIVRWNLLRFAESLLPLLHPDTKAAITLVKEWIASFDTSFQHQWLSMMHKKLGLFNEEKEDSTLIHDLLDWMYQNHADYTNTFRDLISKDIPSKALYTKANFQAWWQRWQNRVQRNNRSLEMSFQLMLTHNPALIPRNHKVEAVLSTAEKDLDFAKLHHLLQAFKDPYVENPEFIEFCQPPKPEERIGQTFCGT